MFSSWVLMNAEISWRCWLWRPVTRGVFLCSFCCLATDWSMYHHPAGSVRVCASDSHGRTSVSPRWAWRKLMPRRHWRTSLMYVKYASPVPTYDAAIHLELCKKLLTHTVVFTLDVLETTGCRTWVCMIIIRFVWFVRGWLQAQPFHGQGQWSPRPRFFVLGVCVQIGISNIHIPWSLHALLVNCCWLLPS